MSPILHRNKHNSPALARDVGRWSLLALTVNCVVGAGILGLPGKVAIWDNRSTRHYPVADYWPATRRMERVTIAGDRPR